VRWAGLFKRKCLPGVFATIVIKEFAGLAWPQRLDQVS
jgi:hypothetical protein